ncbi:MAG: carboxypeptidase Taq [Elusimicrobia bacterium]|nr:MAG: carboxypeptidase Taq [Elusimicrobiota bacterium]KAF0157860.1 MAG: carboxypeptidase Taq [Elusimicrobiota bacterium]
MENKFAELRKRYEEVSALGSARAVLAWDQRVTMPPGGAPARARSMSALARTVHSKATAPEIGRLIGETWDWAQAKGPDSFEAAYLRVLKRDYDHATKLPSEFVGEMSAAASAAMAAWESAKKNSDFPSFAPHLEKMVDINRRQAEYLAPGEPHYDTLLDLYEPGMRRAELEPLLTELSEGMKPVLRAIAERRAAVSNEILKGDFEEGAQLALADEIVKALGFDFSKGRQDRSVHPFTTGFSLSDVRITTWTMRGWLPASIYASMHECGHALYGMGAPAEFELTPLAGGAGLGVHESQSRFWENFVGRSRPFCEWLLPGLRRHFPGKFDRVSPEQFYLAVNKSEPSFIRVEADEATYDMHIALRFRLETALLDGALKVKDLPGAWNAGMNELFGITPKNDAEGVLQDVHWSQGTIGYFPTYSLGNLMAAQLDEAMRADIKDMDGLIARGEFAPPLAWLRERVHRHGARYFPADLLRKAIGKERETAPFLRYIKTKYSAIYKF